MTNQEAIHIIENVNANTNCDNCFYKYDATCEDCRVETALNMAIEALENQKSIIDELEKIKAEFEDKILLNQTVAIQIIDKYIAELKGENK